MNSFKISVLLINIGRIFNFTKYFKINKEMDINRTYYNILVGRWKKTKQGRASWADPSGIVLSGVPSVIVKKSVE
jgi:hypothetical protein